MSFKNYKDSLGLIGVDSLSFLADRMFAVMDEDVKGYVRRIRSFRLSIHLIAVILIKSV